MICNTGAVFIFYLPVADSVPLLHFPCRDVKASNKRTQPHHHMLSNINTALNTENPCPRTHFPAKRVRKRTSKQTQLQLEAVFKTAPGAQRQRTSVRISRRFWFRLFPLRPKGRSCDECGIRSRDACGEAVMWRLGGARGETDWPVILSL